LKQQHSMSVAGGKEQQGRRLGPCCTDCHKVTLNQSVGREIL
jgi:hypothetical protein